MGALTVQLGNDWIAGESMQERFRGYFALGYKGGIAQLLPHRNGR